MSLLLIRDGRKEQHPCRFPIYLPEPHTSFCSAVHQLKNREKVSPSSLESMVTIN